jgi:hypothetical protein
VRRRSARSAVGVSPGNGATPCSAVQRHAERELIRRRGRGLAIERLGRHERGRANEHAAVVTDADLPRAVAVLMVHAGHNKPEVGHAATPWASISTLSGLKSR